MFKRIKFFLGHLFISLVIALLVMSFVFFVWYPLPLATAVGVTHIFLMMLVIDVIIGPLLGLFVYKEGKTSLKFDLSIIIAIQTSALCYGIYNKYKESYPENWARRIVWAYDKLIQTKSINNIYSSDIRKLSGVKEKNFDEANKYLPKYADNNKVNAIRNIIKKHSMSI